MSSENKHATIPKVSEELTRKDSSIRIVGSLARHSIMGLHLPEFHDDGSRRDIDYFTLSEDNKKLPVEQEVSGVRLDGDFNRWIQTEANGTYLVHPHKPTLAVELPHAEEVFAPYTVDHEDARITTIAPEVLDRLHYLKGRLRPKDRESAVKYHNYLTSLGASALDPELLEPFEEFGRQLHQNRALSVRSVIRNGYYRALPEKTRKKVKISRFMRPPTDHKQTLQ